MSFGEQYLSTAAMHEKLRMAIAVLRSQPNRWISLMEMDREIGCGALIARFPLVWRSHMLKTFPLSSSSSDSSSSSSSNLATFKCRYRSASTTISSSSSAAAAANNKDPIDASLFELQYSAPVYRDLKDITKHLRQANQHRGSMLSSAAASATVAGAGGGGATAMSSAASGPGVPIDALASGRTRPQSLAVVQRAVDADWCYVVHAQRPPYSLYSSYAGGMNSAAAAAAGGNNNNKNNNNKDSTSATSMANATAHLLRGGRGGRGGGGVRRPRTDGGGDEQQQHGGGGGGIDNTGTGDAAAAGASFMGGAGLQQTTSGSRGIGAALQEQFRVDCIVSTKVHNSSISFPAGVFLPQQMQLPAVVSMASGNASAVSAGAGKAGVIAAAPAQQQQQHQQSAQDESDCWLVRLSRPVEIAAAPSSLSSGGKIVALDPPAPSLKISLTSNPPAAFEIYPVQLTVPAQRRVNNNSNNNQAQTDMASCSSPAVAAALKNWQGMFRVKPLRESKAQLTLTVTTILPGSNNSNSSSGASAGNTVDSSAATAPPPPENTFACEVHIKRRFPVDDATLYRTPPVLYYRGIGSVAVLPALGAWQQQNLLVQLQLQQQQQQQQQEEATGGDSAELRTLPGDDDNGRSKNKKKESDDAAAASSIDKRLIAESVRRSIEPIPALLQATIASGATFRPSQQNLDYSEQAVFLSSAASRLAAAGGGGGVGLSSSSAAGGVEVSLLDRQLLQQQRRQRLEAERHQRQERERLRQLAEASGKDADGSKRFKKKFSNAHMLHLGVDTRKMYSSGKELREQQELHGIGARPLEQMDLLSLI